MIKYTSRPATPHRSYRKLKTNKAYAVFESTIMLSILALFMYLFLFYFFPYFLSEFYLQLQNYGIFPKLASVDIFSITFQVLDLPYSYLQPITKYIWLILLVISYFGLLKQKFIPYNVVMWLNFFIILTAIFVLYFIFFTKYYPYNMVTFLELYLHATFGFIFFSALIMLAVFVLTPINIISKTIIFTFSIVYFMLYSTIRFALLVLYTSQVSVIFAPLMFFTLYLDFFFFISIYTYALAIKSKSTNRMEKLWIW